MTDQEKKLGYLSPNEFYLTKFANPKVAFVYEFNIYKKPKTP